ncbi:MAG: 5'-nucleotidase, lipoprotein e(P4) family [Mucilaginibacter polytrichastri]|nr:5'-nucleotidase, lipoprotein e(P4) family [Mucilaginibacter polytrichastri]
MKYRAFFTLLFLLAAAPAFAQEKPGQRDNMNAVLWQQHAGEYRALCFQAYNFARLRLDDFLTRYKPAKPLCVIVDADETVIDNSAFEGFELKAGRSYDPHDWKTWTALGIADTVPGALQFLKYAVTKNVETFYVTNRGESERAGTLKNLKKWGFPFADDKHLLLKSETSDKEPRRKKVGETHIIVLLCGDNLNDFSDVFMTTDEQKRNSSVNEAQVLFGQKFIVLPNPMYGDWADALFDGKKGLTEQEKADQRVQKLRSFQP